jgi:hypothetical protein
VWFILKIYCIFDKKSLHLQAKHTQALPGKSNTIRNEKIEDLIQIFMQELLALPNCLENKRKWMVLKLSCVLPETNFYELLRTRNAQREIKFLG